MIINRISTHYLGNRADKIFSGLQQGELELIIVLEGECNITFNNFKSEIKKGDVFLLRGDYEKNIIQCKDFCFCSIYYHESKLEQVSGPFQFLQGYREFFLYNTTKIEKLNLSPSIFQEIIIIINMIVSEKEQVLAGFSQIINSSFLILITLISREYEKDVVANKSIDIGVSSAITFMKNNYCENIMIDDLAKIANLSSRQYNRKFKKLFNISPIKYLIKIRIERSCYLLKYSDDSILKISLDCGFVSANYFSKCFKNEHNISPSEYRNLESNSLRK